MDRRQYEKAFDKNLTNLKYTEALEVVGAMKYENIPRTRYREMLIFYEQGDFERIRRTLRGKKLDNLEERELYLASLTELQLGDEFERAYNPSDAMSGSSLYYIEGKRKKQGLEMPAEQEEIMDYPTYFDRRYRWFLAEQVTDIYNTNETRLMMMDAGMPQAEADELLRDLNMMLEMFRFDDVIKDRFRKSIASNEHIPEDMALYYPLMHEVSTYDPDRVFRRYGSLAEIVSFVRLTRKIDDPGAERQALEVYWKDLSEASKDGSAVVTDLLKYLYADLGYLREYEGGYRYADEIHDLLEKEAPDVIKEMEGHTIRKEPGDTLSVRGKTMYSAACWQLCNAMGNDMSGCEPDTICRAFILLLQLELNERVIWPLCDRTDTRQKYEEFKSKLEEVDAGRFEKEWGYLISGLQDMSSLRHRQTGFGIMYALFNSLKFKRYKKESPDREFAGMIRLFLEELLTEEGRTALADGTLAKMAQPRIWEMFKGTAADTRFTGIETALRCREYVEQKLKDLALYVKA